MRRSTLALLALALLAVAATAAKALPTLGLEDRDPAGDAALVWAVGDAADGSEPSRALARRIVTSRPQKILYLGDVYDEGSLDDYEDNYTPLYGSVTGITAPTPGNHEYPHRFDGYFRYWERANGAPLPEWYTFEVGGWRVFSLSSESPRDPASEQVNWVRGELARVPGTCALAFWHRPRMSIGKHGDNVDVQPLWDAVRGHVSMVVNGHDHNSQRFAPRDGITQYVAGAGGKELYRFDEESVGGRPAFGADDTTAALRIRLRPGRADTEFVTPEGKVLDRSTVRCTPPPAA